MAGVTVTWESQLRFDGTDSKGIPVDIDGRQDLGVRPSDLLPMALASCSGVDVVSQLGEDVLTDLSIEVSYNKELDPPWKFQRFRLHYRLSGPTLTADRVEEAIQRSHAEMCSVAAAVRGNIPIETSFELVE
jgi:putative redox protein